MEWPNGKFPFKRIKIKRTKTTHTNTVSERSTKGNNFGVLTRPENPTTDGETTSISGELFDDLHGFPPLFLPKVAIILADL